MGLVLVALPLGCADGNLVAASQGDNVPPKVLDDVMPVYPEWALDQGGRIGTVAQADANVAWNGGRSCSLKGGRLVDLPIS